MEGGRAWWEWIKVGVDGGCGVEGMSGTVQCHPQTCDERQSRDW